jgi:hypothetical protein
MRRSIQSWWHKGRFDCRFATGVPGNSKHDVHTMSNRSLYIVVHHPKDHSQPYSNAWLDGDRLEAITTPTEVGALCDSARQKRERVYVHRCGWSEVKPTICCSVSVARVDSIDSETKLVRFDNQQLLASAPRVPVRPGQNFYFA